MVRIGINMQYFIKTIVILLVVLNIHTLTAEYPDYDITINGNPYPDKLFIHSMSSTNPHIGILNPDLSLHWNIYSGEQGFDFRENNGRLSYYDKINQFWIIADSNMNETDTLSCANNIRTDYHDIRLLNNGGYILQGYDSLWTDMSEIVEGGHSFALIRDILVIQEFDNDHNLILEWRADNHLDILNYSDYLDLTSFQITWMHGNSIEVDYDNNLLLSNRTNNEIIKIDRATGDILWIMGGPLNEFTFIDDPLNGFNKQHDVRRIENGNITLFDNGTQHEPMLSRAVEYEIDELNKTATLIWEYSHPDNIVAMSMGSVQRLPNQNTLINWGFFFETNLMDTGALIMEVDYDKNIVFELAYPVSYHTYRVRKSNWDFTINLVPGDANLDNIVDIIDCVFLVNYILNSADRDNTLFNRYKLDLNTDGEINVLDITTIINIILS